MEEMMINNIPTEEVTEVAANGIETIPNTGMSGVKKTMLVGGIMTLGALSWEFAIKPACKKIKAAKARRKARKEMKVSVTNNQPTAVVTDDLEDEYPIIERK